MQRLMQRLRDERGASLVEYALLAALVAVPSLVAMDHLGTVINERFEAANADDYSAASSEIGDSDESDDSNTGDSGNSDDSGDSDYSGDTTTTSTTTSTTTTTTAAPGGTGENPGETAPDEQYVAGNSYRAGPVTLGLVDGEIFVEGFDLNRRWRGEVIVQDDGSLVVRLTKRSGAVTMTAWVDDDGYLHVNVAS